MSIKAGLVLAVLFCPASAIAADKPQLTVDDLVELSEKLQEIPKTDTSAKQAILEAEIRAEFFKAHENETFTAVLNVVDVKELRDDYEILFEREIGDGFELHIGVILVKKKSWHPS